MIKQAIILTITLCSYYFGYSQPNQWRGPLRDGHFPETGLLKTWPEEGPALLLEVDKIGKGYSSPVLVNGIIYTTGMIDTLDYLTATDLKGNRKWQVPYGRSWNKSFPDTRSTPVVDGSKIYVQSGTGRLNCINASNGEVIWAVEVDKDYHTEYHSWGNSETPLLIDNLVICSPGGKETSVVAFDKNSGKMVWKTQSVGGPRCYLSAVEYKYRNFRYILAATGAYLMAIVPGTGEIAWSYKYLKDGKWDQPGLIWANTPIFKEDEIFISMGYNYFGAMLKMAPDGKSASEKYTTEVLDNHHHGVIYYNGYLYGSNWQSNAKGRWVCLDWNTGDVKFETEWDTKGVIVEADNMFYCYNEKGGVALVNPTPDKFDIVSQFKITKGSGAHWAHPFISDGKLFMRHGDVMMVYDIKAK